jgi:hexosaminidase
MTSHHLQPLRDLMPMPAIAEAAEGRLAIDGDFSIGCVAHSDELLQRALARFRRRLFAATGIPMKRGLAAAGEKATLMIRCGGPAEAVLSIDTDESYRLRIEASGAELSAPTPIGVIRGLETLLQLVAMDDRGFFVPGARIDDRPRFAWRGLLLDVVRHWLPKADVLRVLDGMAAVKLNVLHLHLSDDQGFRVECRAYPKLHELGSDGDYFTHDDIRELIAFAHDRGIRIVPEFDMPGHATAWFVGYPQLASSPGPYEIERRTGISEPSFDPTREEVYAFIDGFVAEMASLFPDECYHFGGDEVRPKRWQESATVQAFMRERGFATIPDLQAHFSERVAGIVEKRGKTVIGWDEVLHGHLPRSVIVQAWQQYEPLVAAVKSGYRAILSHGWYLDMCLHADYHYGIDPFTGPGGETLSEAEKENILGGEACLWGEWVSTENLDIRLWPRLAAVAERLWSPGHLSNASDMYRRLEIAERRLHDLGMQQRTAHERMLRRTCGSRQVLRALHALASVVEPLKGYERHKWRRYGDAVALNRLVDAVAPESAFVTRVAHAVDAAIATHFAAHHMKWLHERLAEVYEATDGLEMQLGQHPLLSECGPLVKPLRDLLRVALRRMMPLGPLLPEGVPSADEVEAALERAAQPQAELLIPLVGPIRKLLDALASRRK